MPDLFSDIHHLEEGERGSLLSTNASVDIQGMLLFKSFVASCQLIDVFQADRPFRTEPTSCGVRRLMVLWTCLGLAVAASHHFIGLYLNGRPVQERLPFGNKVFTYQQIVNAAGNVMALIVNTSFKAAIGIFFVQQFWFQIRGRSFSAKQINSIITLQTSPLSPTALRVFPSAVLLFAIALITFSLSIIPVIAPGSLTVAQTYFTQRSLCEVPQIQLQFPIVLSNYVGIGPDVNLANSSLPAIRNLAGVVLLLKSYLPPTTPCGQCKYDVTINSPAITCQNTPNVGPMTQHSGRGISTTDESPNDGYAITPILTDNFLWNATYSLNSAGLVLLASWRSGSFKNDSFGEIKAALCTAHNATYYANVAHGISTATMNVTSVNLHNTLSLPNNSVDSSFNESLSMLAMVDALAFQIQGALSFDSSGNPVSQTSMASYTLGTIVNDGYWNWVTDPQIAIPLMMQNFTLSMLSRNLGNDPHQSTVGNIRQECWLSPLTFQYDQLRLTGTYIAGAFVTIVCVVAGFWIVNKNAVEESFELSRWIDALVHQEMLVQDKEILQLKPHTQLRLRKEDNRLVMVADKKSLT
jgi:hypothetical protein